MGRFRALFHFLFTAQSLSYVNRQILHKIKFEIFFHLPKIINFSNTHTVECLAFYNIPSKCTKSLTQLNESVHSVVFNSIPSKLKYFFLLTKIVF